MSDLKRNRFAGMGPGTPSNLPPGPNTPGHTNTPGHATTPGRTTPAYQMRGMPTPDRQSGTILTVVCFYLVKAVFSSLYCKKSAFQILL